MEDTGWNRFEEESQLVSVPVTQNQSALRTKIKKRTPLEKGSSFKFQIIQFDKEFKKAENKISKTVN